MPESPATSRRRAPYRIRAAFHPVPIALTCLLGSLLPGCGASRPAPLVGTLERHRLEIASPVAEQVVELDVREGDRVTKGQLLARMDPGTAAQARAAAAAEVERQRKRLDELQRGARTEEIRAAQAQLAAAQAKAAQASREYARQAGLAAQGIVSQSQFDQQRAARDAALADQNAAAADLKLLQEGTRSEQIAQGSAALANAQAQLQQQDVQLARLELHAPADATVESITFRVGERPQPGQPVLVLLEAGAPFARVYVPEGERAALKAGQAASIKVDGVGQLLQGRLRYIASDATFTPYYALTQRDRGRLSYLAEFDVTDAAAAQLAVGLPLEVTPGAVDPGANR
ncbi:MAG TPA: HlyD family efflux transporter periplasmic adaptor subunit [Steroidobacteraceae bacterium]|nr:HlyD family efflux transporter periplasmic adaptor subunit [Steroidobacteraceae bacterium]